jgi:hypothetical protein
MRSVSKKTAKKKRLADPLRRRFVEAKLVCEGLLLGCTAAAVDAHEIARGYAKSECEKHTDLQLALCRSCHNIIQDWPTEKQYALRVQRSLETLNRIMGRAPTAITWEEITAARQELEKR